MAFVTEARPPVPYAGPVADVYSGTFTFLLTDIEGSTRLWESAPADMARALVRHDDLITGLIGISGGRLVRSRGEGDSAFAVFDDPLRALTCAVELQRALRAEAWPAAAPIRVRISLHIGPAQARGEDYFGPGVNRAARLRAVAHGGQILISADTRDAVANALPDGVWLSDLGLHRLKDLAHPEHIWQVGHGDLANDFPPLRSLDARGHNLPVQLTGFVGREMEVLGLRKRLEVSPLVTLTGPGGIGKTRLALQCAAEMTDDHPDGVWLVELASVREAAHVAPAIAGVLGVREEPDRPVVDSIVDHLAGRKLLIVLDNCEHLVDECAQVVHTLLTAAGGLRILATSREALRVYGEATHAVPTLELPEATSAFPEEAMASDAVRLFVDRAELADHDFTLGPHSGEVVHICRRLEGIPLAIELAAAHVRTSSVAEIAERLHDRLGALDAGPRTAPERHRTLRAAIESSYERLTGAEQAVFVRLSAFSGGFTIDAAADVCAGDGVDAADMPTLVKRLADASLLQTRATPVGTRYVMLETIRDFAAERTGDELAVRISDLHTRWALAFISRHGPRTRSADAADAIAHIDEDLDNLRTAISRSFESDPDTVISIIEHLFGYWFSAGHLREGREWCRRGFDATSDPLRRVRLGLYEGQLAQTQGDPAAIPLLEEHIAAARALHDTESVGLGLNILAGAAIQAGRVADAKTMASEALTLLRRKGKPRNVVQALNVLGVAATVEGDVPAAYALYEDALAICRDNDMQETISRLLLNLGNLSAGRSDVKRAIEYYAEARELALAVGDVQGASAALTNLGVMAKAEGDYVGARRLLDEALAVKREMGDGRGIAIALQSLSEIDRHEGSYASAQRLMQQSLTTCLDLQFSQGMILGLETIAALLADTGRAVAGLRFAAAAEAARTSTGQRRSIDDSAEFDRVVTTLRDLAGREAGRSWDEGLELALSDAVTEAITLAVPEHA